jgi:hypothetical protein
LPIHLREIDDTNRSDHSRLTPDDHCFYLYEFTAFEHTGGLGFRYSDTNQLIHNLKKKPSERLTKGGWGYKARAINESAAALRQAMNPDWLATATLVPVPSSKAGDHPDFDDRISQICRALRNPPPDVRALVINTHSHEAAHESGHRPSVEELSAIYEVDDQTANSAPVTSIGIVDDVLTAGTHFRAMQIKLSQRFPGVAIFGFFVARRALPKVDLSVLAALLATIPKQGS